MADDDLALNAFRKWNDVELQAGGAVRDVTKIRFFLGRHGPFERTFDRAVSDADLQQAIRDERSSLESITRT
jgi:hypothetical protein